MVIRKVVSFSCGGTIVILFLSAIVAFPAPLQLISARDPSRSPPAGANGDSWSPLMTPDGRFVVFSSSANNLVNGINGLPLPNVFPAKLNTFLRDRVAGSTTLVSINSAGTGGGNGNSIPTAISTNGRYVCFESTATDLITNDLNRASDVFVRDLQNNTT